MNSKDIVPSHDISHADQPFSIGAESGMLDVYDGLKTPFSLDTIRLSAEHTNQIASFAALAIAHYGPDDADGHQRPETTHIQQSHHVPMLVARVDCTINPISGNIVPYELEDSPSGIGITDILHKAGGTQGIKDIVRDHYISVLGELPFVLVSGMRNHGTDDPLIVGHENYSYRAGSANIPTRIRDNQPVIVKAIPGQPVSLKPYLSLRDKAVCTMASEGDKTYTRRLGMNQAVTSVAESGLDINRLPSVVVKRAVGSMAMGVKIHLNAADKARHGSHGTVKAGKFMRHMEDYIAQDGLAYIQKFEGPVRITNPERRGNMILRIFTLVEPRSSATESVKTHVVGGCYVARPELVVHGASNAVGGAVIV